MKVTKEKLLSKVLVTAAAVLGFAYIGAAWYFQDQFLYDTRIGIVNASYLTVDEVEERLSEALHSYVLTVKAKDGEQAEITAEDIDMEYDFGEQIQQIKDSQNALAWLPAMLSKPVRYEVDIRAVYDEEKLSECLEDIDFLNPENMTAPVDAKLSYSEKEGFSLQRSVEGNTVDMALLEEKLADALTREESELDLKKEGCYREPRVTEDSEEIRKVTDRLDEMTDFTITYAFGETKEVIDRDVMWKWYRLDDRDELVLKEDAVRDYVTELAAKYDTVGAKRKFHTSKGKDIEVSDGPYGWKIDQKKEYAELLALVKAKKSVEDRQPVYARTGFGKVRGTDDIGDTYVEISIEDQHMWYYEKGKLFLDTDVVTGKGGRHTKRGVAYIHNKARNATLVGADYVSFVKYWMKVWNGIGIHDASWRNKFGGTIYLTSGSHGCINTPLDNVIKLYNEVEIGTPVVIY